MADGDFLPSAILIKGLWSVYYQKITKTIQYGLPMKPIEYRINQLFGGIQEKVGRIQCLISGKIPKETKNG